MVQVGKSERGPERILDVAQMADVAATLDGNLTGCVYSDTTGKDDDDYARLAPVLRGKVGRLLNDKMPTGVAVSPAMNHGGPYPSTGHPGFTAVGIPAALRRFAMLQCFDQVRAGRLPAGKRLRAHALSRPSSGSRPFPSRFPRSPSRAPGSTPCRSRRESPS